MAKESKNLWQQTIAVIIALLMVSGFAFWYWYNQKFLDPKTTFWSTIDQSMQTGFITMTTSQKNGAQKTTQQNNLQYKNRLIANNFVTITDENTKSTVITQTIGTVKADYLKYEKIEAKYLGNFNKNSVNIWAISKSNPRILNDTLISSPIIFGYLPSSSRSELTNQMKNQNVFGVDYNSVNKSAKLNGKKVYTYDLNINLPRYLKIYSNYLNKIGQNNLAKQMANSSANGTYSASLYIDYVTRRPIKIQPKSGDVGLEYSNFGLVNTIQEPQNVNLSIDQLQLKINN